MRVTGDRSMGHRQRSSFGTVSIQSILKDRGHSFILYLICFQPLKRGAGQGKDYSSALIPYYVVYTLVRFYENIYVLKLLRGASVKHHY